jgi:hypothetical protein
MNATFSRALAIVSIVTGAGGFLSPAVAGDAPAADVCVFYDVPLNIPGKYPTARIRVCYPKNPASPPVTTIVGLGGQPIKPISGILPPGVKPVGTSIGCLMVGAACIPTPDNTNQGDPVIDPLRGPVLCGMDANGRPVSGPLACLNNCLLDLVGCPISFPSLGDPALSYPTAPDDAPHPPY